MPPHSARARARSLSLPRARARAVFGCTCVCLLFRVRVRVRVGERPRAIYGVCGMSLCGVCVWYAWGSEGADGSVLCPEEAVVSRGCRAACGALRESVCC
jgi:hypothetical protein